MNVTKAQRGFDPSEVRCEKAKKRKEASNIFNSTSIWDTPKIEINMGLYHKLEEDELGMFDAHTTTTATSPGTRNRVKLDLATFPRR